MKSNTATAIVLTSTTAAVSAFSVLPPVTQHQNTHVIRGKTELYGLFDGVKDAFTQPPSSLDAERETPIDRWMGWSVVSENEVKQTAAPVDFVDSMDEKNYVGVSLAKPMGIVFEENDTEYGGIFVQSLTEDGAAAKNGILQPGDQLVVVGTKNVSGLDFDDALAAIIESEGDFTSLTLFRGTAKQFYGPTGPSKQWLSTFSEKGGVTETSPAASGEAPVE